MFKTNGNVEAVSTYNNYSFTAIPSNYIYLLDIYCYKLFATLVQKESYCKNNNQLSEDGYFSLRIEDISKSLGCNTKEINCTIEALYCCGLISVISIGKSGTRITNRYKINWNKVVELGSISIQKILDEEMTINKCARGTTLTYRQQTEVRTTPRTNCHTTIDNINNIDNLNNLNNDITIANDHIANEEINLIEVNEYTTNEELSLDELLNTDNVIEVNDTTINTYIPINDDLFIPDIEDSNNEITSTDNVNINFEVCESSEQREEDKTNDINVNKPQVELRSLTNEQTSIEVDSLTLSDISISSLDNNEHTKNENNLYNSTLFIKNTPQPPTTEINEYTNEMEKELEELLKNDWQIPTSSNTINNDEFTKRVKFITDCINDFKQSPTENKKALISSHIQITKWMYERGEITQKQMDWINKLQANFDKINGAIYIHNKPTQNKAVLSRFDTSDNKSITRAEETQQDANKEAKMTYIERECNKQNKKFDLDTLNYIVTVVNQYVNSTEEKTEWINRYFDGINHSMPSYLELMKNKALAKVC